MVDEQIRNLQRDIEQLIQRIRTLENVQGPNQLQVLSEFRKLQEKVADMDVHGTGVTQVQIKNITEDVKDLKDDTKSLRSTVRSALITASFGIVEGLILYGVLRGKT